MWSGKFQATIPGGSDFRDGVLQFPYERCTVTVQDPSGVSHNCRAFSVWDPDPNGFPLARAYKEMLLEGAREHALPREHIEFLSGFETQENRCCTLAQHERNYG